MSIKVIKVEEDKDTIKNWFEYMSYFIGKDEVEKLINGASIADLYYSTARHCSHLNPPHIVLAGLINMIAQTDSKRASFLV